MTAAAGAECHTLRAGIRAGSGAQTSGLAHGQRLPAAAKFDHRGLARNTQVFDAVSGGFAGADPARLAAVDGDQHPVANNTVDVDLGGMDQRCTGQY